MEDHKILPHWERGYRGWGYWIGIRRFAYIGLPPYGYPRTYRWSLGDSHSGETSSLSQAKKQIEKLYVQCQPVKEQQFVQR